MQSKATTVDQYLAELPADRRAGIEAVRKIFRQNLSKGFEEGMQYGMIGYYVPHRIYPDGYHCDPRQPLPYAALGSQKNYMSIYLGSIYGHAPLRAWFEKAWADAGKKLDAGKSCIRFKRVEDLAVDVLAEAIRRVPMEKYLEVYESAIKTMRTSRQKGKKKAAAKKPAAKKAAVKKAAIKKKAATKKASAGKRKVSS